MRRARPAPARGVAALRGERAVPCPAERDDFVSGGVIGLNINSGRHGSPSDLRVLHQVSHLKGTSVTDAIGSPCRLCSSDARGVRPHSRVGLRSGGDHLFRAGSVRVPGGRWAQDEAVPRVASCPVVSRPRSHRWTGRRREGGPGKIRLGPPVPDSPTVSPCHSLLSGLGAFGCRVRGLPVPDGSVGRASGLVVAG